MSKRRERHRQSARLKDNDAPHPGPLPTAETEMSRSDTGVQGRSHPTHRRKEWKNELGESQIFSTAAGLPFDQGLPEVVLPSLFLLEGRVPRVHDFSPPEEMGTRGAGPSGVR